jgi:hypothetical protein
MVVAAHDGVAAQQPAATRLVRNLRQRV